MKINTQRIASIARQIGAGLVSVYGFLSLKDVAPHLPVWLASVMVMVGPAFQIIEHYLSDPSTGTPAPPMAKNPPQAVPALPTQPTATVG